MSVGHQMRSPWRQWGLLVGMLTCAVGLIAYVIFTVKRPKLSDRELLRRAKVAIDLHKPTIAIGHLEELIRRSPQHDEALLYRAQLARDSGDDAAALAWLARIAVRENTLSGTARFLEGTIALAQSRARVAEELFRKSSQLHPTFPQPHERLIQLFALQLRREDVLEQLAELARIRPLQLVEQALAITAGERLAAPDLGISSLEPFAAQDAQDTRSLFALGTYYRDALREKEAIQTFENVLRIAPEHATAKAAIAQILIDRQEFAAASKILATTKLSSASPRSLWVAHGNYFLAQSSWKSAAACFAEAAHLDPLDRAAFSQMGIALKRLDKNDESLAAMTRAATLANLRERFETLGIMHARGQLNAETLWQVVQILREIGDSTHAAIWAEQARLLDPELSATGAVPASKRLTAIGDDSLPTIIAGYRGHAPHVTEMRALGDTNRVSTKTQPSFQFRDDATERGLDFTYFNGESGSKYLIESMGGGVGVLDFDGDHWPDLFFPQGSLFPPAQDIVHKDQLYRNVGGDRFVPVPESAGVGDPRYGLGVATGDLDNDGFDDLVVGNLGRNTILRNQGDGTFVDVTAAASVLVEEMSTSVGLADLDRDGLLDIFVVNYVDSLKVCRNDRGEISTCSPSNHAGANDRVYRNLGDGRFEDVSSTIGLAPGGKGLGVVLADFDDDGWVDAVVSNDTTPNFFYRNQGRSGKLGFTEEGLTSGLALSEVGVAQAGMGIACGDLNGDAKLDLYVSYFYREANGLYLNEGSGLFREITRAAGLYQPTFGLLGFGTQAADFDLDGVLELFVANGHIDDQRSLGIPWKMPPQLFWRDQADHFTDVSAASGEYFLGEYLGRGAARMDWNRDGRPDLVVAHQDRQVAILTNQTERSGNALRLTLRGVDSNRSAVGTSVFVTADGQLQRIDVTAGDGYLCQNDRQILIGLGAKSRAERVEIHWPSGRNDRLEQLAAKDWFLIEGQKPIEIQGHTVGQK